MAIGRHWNARSIDLPPFVRQQSASALNVRSLRSVHFKLRPQLFWVGVPTYPKAQTRGAEAGVPTYPEAQTGVDLGI